MIAVTMGDPNGVGPEIVLKAWVNREIERDLILIGDVEILRYCAGRMGLDVPFQPVSSAEEVQDGKLNVLDLGILRGSELNIGHVSEAGGRAALSYVKEAMHLVLSRKVEAICTLPINKEAVRLTDSTFTGHTDYIARMCGVTRYTMMLASDRLTVTHVSTHVSLAEAIRRVKRERVLDVISLTYGALARFKARPRIAVAGLNPHAGENQSFGEEDELEIRPAVEAAQADGMEVVGPEPPDTVFLKAIRGVYDAVVSMYHDQGHIPSKLLDFEGGVNITLGLPIVRTSVDHGTGFDIAYKGIASTQSFVKAYKYAQMLISKGGK
jgi:4-hydroxythreonine-4-phosphate dehydrogenase